MKSSALASLLTGAAMISALVTGWVSLQYIIASRKVVSIQREMMRLNSIRTSAQSLAAEAVEYSKTHPNIDPILVQFEIKPRPTNAPAPANTRPASK